jgi:hypothetical protein
VGDDAGVPLGRLVDLAIAPSGPAPVALAAQLRSGRNRTWRAPVRISRDDGAVRLLGSEPVDGPPRGSLLLQRDVLDTQVVDLRGRRLARVGDVILADSGGRLEVVAVEAGLADVLRRLGLRPLAARLPRDAIGWEHLHPASGRAHALALDTPSSRIHHLDHAELRTVLESLPVHRGADLLERTHPERAASVLAALEPTHRTRLLRKLPHAHRSQVEKAMAHVPAPDADQRRARHRPRLRRPGRHAQT